MVLAIPYQDGKIINYTNTGEVTIAYNEIVEIGDRIAIACHEIGIGCTGSLKLEGVYGLPATSQSTFSVGQDVYWDTDNSVVTAVPGALPIAGMITETKSSGTTIAYVKLGPQTKDSDSSAMSLVGDLNDLDTEANDSIVEAINEVNTNADTALSRVATNQANSTASDVSGIVADFNTLLGKLKTAGLMASGS